jgi:hypothetical protein
MPHGALTHFIQDLVVDNALRDAGAGVRFRKLLDRAEGVVERYSPGTKTLSEFADTDNLVFVDPEVRMPVGDYVWRHTYDLLYWNAGMWCRPQPEAMWSALSKLKLFGGKL